MNYYIIAGEASGDLHGSNLIKEIFKLDANATIRAWGGDKMQEAGAKIIKHYKSHNYMGFTEVIIHLRKIMSNFSFCKEDILNFAPDALILIDFPGFNLRIAKWAHSKGIKIIYYISPQIWAWKTSRVHTIKKCVDKMLVILPFEQEFYAKFDVQAEYVGHPLLDSIPTTLPTNLNDNKKLICLLPGSRKQEIKRMLPVMTSLSSSFPDFEFVIAGVSNIDNSLYTKYSTTPTRVEVNQLYDLLSNARAAVVTSGTATLETALNNIPLVVCYKSSRISYSIAKKLIKVKFISLVNLIMNKVVVKELIQKEMNANTLRTELQNLCYSEEYRLEMFNQYNELRNILNQRGASAKAAKIIVNFIT